MESHSADGAQLLDELCNNILWFTLSHHQVAVTKACTRTHTRVKKKNTDMLVRVHIMPGKLHPG